jgi:hypothetical protein
MTAEPSLKSYHLLPSVRGDSLKKLGRSGRLAWNSSAPQRSHAVSANGNCWRREAEHVME